MFLLFFFSKKLFSNGVNGRIVHSVLHFFSEIIGRRAWFFKWDIVNCVIAGSTKTEMSHIALFIVFIALNSADVFTHETPPKGLNYKVTHAMANFCDKHQEFVVYLGEIEVPCQDFRPRLQLLRMRSKK